MRSSRTVLLTLALAAAAGMPAGVMAGGQVAPQLPGQPPIAAPPTLPQPNITPLGDTLVADPLTVAWERPMNDPRYIPGLASCPPPTFRVNSTGGYAPITWTLTRGDGAFELAPPPGAASGVPAAPANPLARRPAGASSRLLRLKSWDGSVNPGVGAGLRGGTVTVEATDGAGLKRSVSATILATRACGAPAITNVSTPTSSTDWVPELQFGVQVSNFDTQDNEPQQLSDSWIECVYQDGLRMACLDGVTAVQPATGGSARLKGGMQFNHQLRRCAANTPCVVKVPNLKGSGSVTLRITNPHGSSSVTATATFPSRSFTETETFVLPASIATTGATVTGVPESAGAFDTTAPGSCSGRYLAWRGVTFSDPSGRAKLSRGVKAGDRVSASTMPQWEVTPGAAQLTMQVTYEMEARRPVCDALVLR